MSRSVPDDIGSDKREGRSAKVMHVLHEVGATLASATRLEDLLPHIVAAGLRITGTEKGELFLTDPVTGELYLRASMGVGDEEVRLMAEKISDSHVNAVIATAKPLRLSHPARVVTGVIAESLLCVPLLSHGRPLGALLVYSGRGGSSLDSDDENNLSLLAGYAGSAIGSSFHLDQGGERAQMLSGLLKISHSLLSVHDLDLLLGVVAQVAHDVLGADPVLLYQYDASKDDVIVPPVFHGTPLKHPDVLLRRGLAHKDSLVYRVLQSHRPFFAPNARVDWYAARLQDLPVDGQDEGFIGREDIASSAGVPLIASSEPVGVLFINFRAPCQFKRDERERIEVFANQAAVAIRNARMVSHLDRLVTELASLNEVGAALGSASVLEIDRILHLIHQQCGRLMPAEQFYIALHEEPNRVQFRLVVEDGELQEVGVKEWAPRVAGNGLTEYVLRTRRPLLLRDGVEEWISRNGIEPIGRPAASWLGVPLIARDRVVGMIGVQSYSRDFAFDEGNLRVLSTLAAQAAVAIDNAALLQERHSKFLEAQSLYKRLETLSYQAVDLIGVPSYAELSSQALTVVARVLDAEAALYVSHQPETEFLELRASYPRAFAERLAQRIQLGGKPLTSVASFAIGPVLQMEARSREQRLEGVLVVQRAGTTSGSAAPFTDADKRMLLLMATAIAHSLQNLRRDWQIQNASGHERESRLSG